MSVRLGVMPSTKPLVHLVVDEALIERIEDFRYRERIPSRAATMKYLMEWALNIADSGTEAMDHFRPPRS